MLSELIKRHKLSIAFLGDIVVFALSMTIVLYVRYGIFSNNIGSFASSFGNSFTTQFSVHLYPFIIVLILWLAIFYISNLYTYNAFGNLLEITKRVTTALLISFAFTITIFYIFSRFFELTPKANLIALAITFGILDITWRYLQRKIFIHKKYCSNVMMLASSPLTNEISEYIDTNPQLGYALYPFNTNMLKLAETIQKNSIAQVVVDGRFFKNNTVIKTLYGILSRSVEITSLTDFYESLFRCIPVSEIEEEWFIREITKNKSIYESTKFMVEIILIIATLPITIPLAIIIGILVATSSHGPIIYKQERVGKNDKPFTLYKFRTMKIDQDGPLWTVERDSRLTSIGKFLRHTHLDEMPQILNVLKGDISFIGPRPERTKLAKIYEVIPYYEIRHIIKPGIIGWAQLNFKPSTSIEEARKKFQFDLYYIKNRSFILDIFILLKTVRLLIMASEK